MQRLWIGFVPYIVVAAVHVGALAVDADAVAAVTKLALMPLLAVAVVRRVRGSRWTTAHTLLVAAIGLSWLGDGAGTFLTSETVFYLTSDTILALRLFTPQAMPDWTSPLVMLTYRLGQGLIAAGVLVAIRARRAAEVTA